MTSLGGTHVRLTGARWAESPSSPRLAAERRTTLTPIKQLYYTIVLIGRWKEGLSCPRRSALRSSEQQPAAAEAQEVKASVRLAYTDVRAPIPGVVDVRAARVGEYVNPGQAIVTLVDPDDLWVRADVEETYIDRVRLGDRLRVRLPSGEEREGTVVHRGVDAVLAGLVLMSLGSVVAGIPNPFEPMRMLRLLLVNVMTALALVSMMFLLMVRVSDPLLPRVTFGVLNTLLFFPSGAVYPQQAFPGWMRAIAQVDPFTYAVHAFKCLLLKDTGLMAVGWDLVYLGAFTVLAMTAATFLFRRTL
jgi:HlyD family secretion protein/ABC-2 type transporter